MNALEMYELELIELAEFDALAELETVGYIEPTEVFAMREFVADHVEFDPELGWVS